MEKAKLDVAKEQSTKPSDMLLGTVILLAIFGVPAFVVWSLVPDSIRYPVLYSMIYQVKASQVHVESRPSDCNWDHAPLGDKGCHYKKQVYTSHDNNGALADVYVGWEKVQD
jgi:hypothetical protein